MTRLNLVDPTELMDQHLMAEYREIKMVPRALKRSIDAAVKRVRSDAALAAVLRRIPPEYTLNTGHVSFFYDKGAYLAHRYNSLTMELLKRGYVIDRSLVLDKLGVHKSLDERFNKDYVPTEKALCTVRERIAARIAEKPDWYRYTSV